HRFGRGRAQRQRGPALGVSTRLDLVSGVHALAGAQSESRVGTDGRPRFGCNPPRAGLAGIYSKAHLLVGLAVHLNSKGGSSSLIPALTSGGFPEWMQGYAHEQKLAFVLRWFDLVHSSPVLLE